MHWHAVNWTTNWETDKNMWNRVAFSSMWMRRSCFWVFWWHGTNLFVLYLYTNRYLNDKWISTLSFSSVTNGKRLPIIMIHHDFETRTVCLICCSIQISHPVHFLSFLVCAFAVGSRSSSFRTEEKNVAIFFSCVVWSCSGVLSLNCFMLQIISMNWCFR